LLIESCYVVLPLEEFVMKGFKKIPCVIQRGGTSKGVYLKLKERQAFDFAVVSVAVSLSLNNNAVDQARITFGGLAPFP
jgi:xanthine dehydrogenase YagS FAD-binding subunit